jgi:hypothetical protein
MSNIMDTYNHDDMYHQYEKNGSYDDTSILLNHLPRKVKIIILLKKHFPIIIGSMKGKKTRVTFAMTVEKVQFDMFCFFG